MLHSLVDDVRQPRGQLLVILSFGWLLLLGLRLAIPAILPQIKAEFSVNNTYAGTVITLVWLTNALSQFPAGVFSDRFGERRLLLIGVSLGTTSMVVFATAPTFAVFVLGAVLLGIGSGLFSTPRVTLLTRLYPKNSASVLGVLFASGNIGATVLPLVFGILGVYLSWRVGFWGLLPIFGLILLGLWYTTQSVAQSAATTTHKSLTLQHLKAAVLERPVILISTTILLMTFSYTGLTGFLLTYLVSTKSIDQSTAALIFSGFFATAIIVQPLAGRLADSLGSRRMLVVLSGIHAVSLFTLPFIDGWLPLLILAVLLGFRGALSPINNEYLLATLPETVRGSGYGLLRSIYFSVGASGSVVVGMLADADYFDGAFLVLGAVALASTLLCLALPARNSLRYAPN